MPQLNAKVQRALHNALNPGARIEEPPEPKHEFLSLNTTITRLSPTLRAAAREIGMSYVDFLRSLMAAEFETEQRRGITTDETTDILALQVRDAVAARRRRREKVSQM